MDNLERQQSRIAWLAFCLVVFMIWSGATFGIHTPTGKAFQAVLIVLLNTVLLAHLGIGIRIAYHAEGSFNQCFAILLVLLNALVIVSLFYAAHMLFATSAL